MKKNMKKWPIAVAALVLIVGIGFGMSNTELLQGRFGTMKPFGSLSNAEFIKAVVLDTGVAIESSPTECAFIDFSSSDWSYEFILTACENGWISDGEVYAHEPIYKASAAKIVYYAYSLPAYSGSATYTDVDKNAWYFEFAEALKAHGVISSKQTKFSPNVEMTAFVKNQWLSKLP